MPPFPLGEARSFLVLKTWRVATPPFSFGQGSLVFSLIEGYIVYCWLEAWLFHEWSYGQRSVALLLLSKVTTFGKLRENAIILLYYSRITTLGMLDLKSCFGLPVTDWWWTIVIWWELCFALVKEVPVDAGLGSRGGHMFSSRVVWTCHGGVLLRAWVSPGAPSCSGS
jgi:hypothetical protein